MNQTSTEVSLEEEESTQTDLRFFGPSGGWGLVDLRELWTYRELVLALAIRDLKVRYRQAIVGVAWVVFQPVITVLIFSVLFRLLDRDPTSKGVPYILSAYAGLVAWQFFAYVLRESSDSLVANRALITKVYFPRIALPFATILCGLVDALIALAVLVLMMFWYQVTPGWQLLALPIFLLLTVVASLAAGLWFAALNALYRDVRYVVPFLIQMGFFVSPVMYETKKLVPEEWWWAYGLNPMVSVIEGVRWSLLGTEPPSLGFSAVSLTAVVVLTLTGLVYFRWAEQWIADRI